LLFPDFADDVTAYGKRFVFATLSGIASTPLTVVVYWSGGLKK